MNMITPREYTMNIMHKIPDIENNMLKVYDERLVKLEEIIWEKFKYENKYFKCVSDWFKFSEAVCLWTMVILLWKKVFN